MMLCLPSNTVPPGLSFPTTARRQLDTTPATISVLPEIVDAVGGKVEVYVDGGIRRGTDVLKAIASGARAVFIGRPVLWDWLPRRTHAEVSYIVERIAVGVCGDLLEAGGAAGRRAVTHRAIFVWPGEIDIPVDVDTTGGVKAGRGKDDFGVCCGELTEDRRADDTCIGADAGGPVTDSIKCLRSIVENVVAVFAVGDGIFACRSTRGGGRGGRGGVDVDGYDGRCSQTRISGDGDLEGIGALHKVVHGG